MGDANANRRRTGVERAGPPSPLPDELPDDDAGRTPPDPVTLSSPRFDAEGRLCWSTPPDRSR